MFLHYQSVGASSGSSICWDSVSRLYTWQSFRALFNRKGVRILRIVSSIPTSDEEPPPDRGGGTKRRRRRDAAAYVATPSHEKTYPSAAPPGTSLSRVGVVPLRSCMW